MRHRQAWDVGAPRKSATRSPRCTMIFEALESRTHLDGSLPTSSTYEREVFAVAPTAYTVSLHHGAESRLPATGTSARPVITSAEREALAGVCLRASGTESAMRPRRPNLVPSMGATPTAGAAEHPREKNPGVPPRNTATRVLVIEDEPLARKAMVSLLRSRGFEVTMAGTVADGVRQLATRPHHVVLDLSLPDGDGEQVLRHIRLRGLQTRVTVTSGSLEPDRLARLRELGASDVLNKPVDINLLANRMATAD